MLSITTQYWRRKVYSVTPHIKTGNPSERDRVNAVNAMLCNSKQEKRIFINPSCKNLIRDFEQVSYKEGSVKIDKTKDMNLTHVSDAFGYMIEKEFAINTREIKGLKIWQISIILT